ncbi:acyl-CoA dehydrogenase [Rhizocola hellebori]|uniref:Acyl-CoA dehydrogenase n=1 Tax=Rhizocola hellebori TaxID=1392758 RepID=A0A8J3QBA7_9ACTN|nr:acyl-CoA dehydrogenase family protein [Rhizocola hellebori]GIH06707.1 acyl-CoA dehydrogenase [Rhizocola hellebori]
MQIELTSEQRAFSDSCARLAADLAAGWHRGRGPGDIDPPAPDEKAWARIADAGWLALGLREENGGIGATAVDLAVLVEQLGYHAVAAPIVGTLMAAQQLQTWQAPAELLADIAAGTLRIAPVLTADLRSFAAVEPAWLLRQDTPNVGPATPPNLGPTAPPNHGETAPPNHGETTPHGHGQTGRPARGTAEAGVLAWDAAGAAMAVLPALGTAYLLADATGFADVTRAVRPLGEPAMTIDLTIPGDDALAGLGAFALSLLTADLLGTMQAALDSAVEHAKVRSQFGAHIGSFQAVQQLLADSHVLVEATRSATYYSAWAVDALPGAQALRAARAAKAFASRSAVEVCEHAIQVFGGIGMTWEAPAHVWLRRAQADRLALGDEHFHYAAIAAAEFAAASTSKSGS